MIARDQIITGERIQQRCQIQINYRKDDQKNPPKSLVITNKTVYICSFIAYELPSQLEFNQCSIYFHNSDQNFLQEININGTNNKIYCQNNGLDKYKVLPIGIANSMWAHGNLDILIQVMKLNQVKIKPIFFNFSIDTNREKRTQCHKICLNKGLQWIPKFHNQQHYLTNLAEHKYAICPEGNGFDSHRIWECFYLGVIPIVIKNPFIDQLVKYLGSEYKIIILNDWEFLNAEQLIKDYQPFAINYQRLKLDYLFEENE